jgi:hypothetical protein
MTWPFKSGLPSCNCRFEVVPALPVRDDAVFGLSTRTCTQNNLSKHQEVSRRTLGHVGNRPRNCHHCGERGGNVGVRARNNNAYRASQDHYSIALRGCLLTVVSLASEIMHLQSCFIFDSSQVYRSAAWAGGSVARHDREEKIDRPPPMLRKAAGTSMSSRRIGTQVADTLTQLTLSRARGQGQDRARASKTRPGEPAVFLHHQFPQRFVSSHRLLPGYSLMQAHRHLPI